MKHLLFITLTPPPKQTLFFCCTSPHALSTLPDSLDNCVLLRHNLSIAGGDQGSYKRLTTFSASINRWVEFLQLVDPHDLISYTTTGFLRSLTALSPFLKNHSFVFYVWCRFVGAIITTLLFLVLHHSTTLSQRHNGFPTSLTNTISYTTATNERYDQAGKECKSSEYEQQAWW